ncbi:restriction endonuclease subunit S [Thauera sp. SWB20]|uniref:restriction endonuclease subunit S n=1 Tax=Thauera sp. SWB20 TaxID=1572758 RepID=UPI0005ADD351|nr:restriction endonuclease subunit S [Thauera sp. SWB20]KIN88825.1 type I restriction modification DNA specificity domain protein [Thauera sp. SWB20]
MTRLGDVADMLVGFAFKSAGFLDADADGVRLLRGDNVQQGYIRWGDKTKKWPSSECDELGRYQLAENDVILAMDRPIVGDGLKMAWIKPEDLPALLVQRVCRLRGKPGSALTSFIRYVLAAPEFSAHIHRITTGANIPHISGKDIAAYEFNLPDLADQSCIVECLSAYDDLIATNQRRIALLEDAARRLYREWFVHLRFPGHESVLVKDGVPEGWAKLSLGDVAEITMGQSPESRYYNTDGDGLPFHQGVSDFGHRFITHETFTRQATRVAAAGDILCSVRAPVGRLNLTRDNIAIGRGLSAMRSRAGHQSLLFYQLRGLFVEEDMIGGGAIFASVGKKELFGQLILQPEAEIAAVFDRIASDIDRQIDTLDAQNRSLADARDLLLPKLMSGQLDVSGVRLPEEVAA